MPQNNTPKIDPASLVDGFLQQYGFEVNVNGSPQQVVGAERVRELLGALTSKRIQVGVSSAKQRDSDDLPKSTELREARGTWGEMADHPRADWREEVANNDTSRGYWEWVAAQMEEKQNSTRTSARADNRDDGPQM